MLPALIALCAICVGMYLYTETIGKKVAALICKALASLCFVLIGFICGNGSLSSRLIICGLVFGFIADILVNLRYTFKKKGQMLHLIGIISFLIGHILYLSVAVSISDNPLISLVAGIIISIFLMLWMYKRISVSVVLKIVGIIYIGAIVLLNTAAIGNMIAMQSSFTCIFALGAVFFLVSDILLILNTFGAKPKRSIRIIHLSLYYLGQVLIALSLALIFAYS